MPANIRERMLAGLERVLQQASGSADHHQNVELPANSILQHLIERRLPLRWRARRSEAAF